MFDNYNVFFYLGITFFITHFFLYGISLDMSYFGAALIYIGWAKPVLSDWFVYILWFFIFIDIYFNVSEIQEKMVLLYRKPKPAVAPTTSPAPTKSKQKDGFICEN